MSIVVFRPALYHFDRLTFDILFEEKKIDLLVPYAPTKKRNIAEKSNFHSRENFDNNIFCLA